MIDIERPWKYSEYEGGFEGCMDDFESLIAQIHSYEIHIEDLDKRASAMLSILANPKSNVRYSRDQAINLCNKCAHANRQDLVTLIQEAMI